MNPDLPKNPREELEARLTALLLGELPADEAFALGRAIEQDPELARLFDRLKQTIHLVRETEAPVPAQTAQSAPLKLSDQRREALLQHFKTVKPKEFVKPSRPRFRILEVAAVLAIAAVLAALMLPTLSRSKSKAQRLSAASSSQLKFGTWGMDNSASAPMPASPSESSPQSKIANGAPTASRDSTSDLSDADTVGTDYSVLAPDAAKTRYGSRDGVAWQTKKLEPPRSQTKGGEVALEFLPNRQLIHHPNPACPPWGLPNRPADRS